MRGRQTYRQREKERKKEASERESARVEGTTWLIGASTGDVPLDVDFRSREGCVNPTPSPRARPLAAAAAPLPSHRVSPLARARSDVSRGRQRAALPIGADTPRGVEADFSRFGNARVSSAASVGPSAGHPPPRSRPRSLKSCACRERAECVARSVSDPRSSLRSPHSWRAQSVCVHASVVRSVRSLARSLIPPRLTLSFLPSSATEEYACSIYSPARTARSARRQPNILDSLRRRVASSSS